ncbi:MAG: hypothetical protein Q9211_002651 [Gyalolechia sp. 1 TL-2023]
MASSREVFNETLKPSFPEFVVALFLAKSKPPYVAVRGACYMANFGLDPSSADLSSQNTSHVSARISEQGIVRQMTTMARDTSTQSYQRLQQETNEQRARIYSLERELDARRDAGSQEHLQQAGKRSALDEVSPRGRSKKRKRTNAKSQRIVTPVSPPTPVPDASTAALQGDAYLTGVDWGMLYCRQAGLLDAIYALQKSLAQSPIVPSQTASILVFIISQLHDFTNSAGPLPHHKDGVNEIYRPQESAVNARTDEEPGRILDPAIGRSVLSLSLAAIDELGHSGNTGGLQKQLEHFIVRFLDGLLNGICSLAAATTKASESSEEQAPVRRRSARGKKSVAPQVPERTADESVMSRCSFLLYAFQALRKGRLADQAIMEGFMFFFLRKIGKTLKVFVFGEHDEEWNAVWTGEDAAVRQEKKLAGERQAPYLIWLLERILVDYASEGNPGSRTWNSSHTVYSSQTKPRQGICPEDVKIQLQQTILKEVLGDNFEEFSKALDAPDDPGLNIEPWEVGRPAGVVDLFKAEVWRLIGWDCLKSDIEWENKRGC